MIKGRSVSTMLKQLTAWCRQIGANSARRPSYAVTPSLSHAVTAALSHTITPTPPYAITPAFPYIIRRRSSTPSRRRTPYAVTAAARRSFTCWSTGAAPAMIWTVPSGATSSIVGACMMLKRWHSSTFSSASSSS